MVQTYRSPTHKTGNWGADMTQRCHGNTEDGTGARLTTARCTRKADGGWGRIKQTWYWRRNGWQ